MKKPLIFLLIFLGMIPKSHVFGHDNLQYVKEHFVNADQYRPEQFANDPFFRISFEIFKEEISDRNVFFQNYTYLIVRPDGLVFGVLPILFNILEESGFQIIAYDSVQFTSNIIKEFWFYESRFFPPGWCRLFDLVLTGKPSLLLLLKNRYPDSITASERLAQMKGHALPKYRSPDSLRSRIGAKGGPFGFVHAPNNPLAVVRELGILFEEAHLRKFLSQRMNQPNTCKSAILSRFQTMDHHDLDDKNALERLRMWAETLDEKLKQQCYRYLEDENQSWDSFLQWVKTNQLIIPEWDLITFCVSRRNWL